MQEVVGEMYFKIMRRGETLVVDDSLLDWHVVYEVNTEPTFTVSLPLHFLEHLVYKNEMILYFDDDAKIHGYFESKNVDYKTGIINVNYVHTLKEWEYQSIPTNVVKKNKKISQLMTDSDIIYNMKSWTIDVQNDARIEYEFSRENKLEGLDKIVSLTDNLHYRVSRRSHRTLEIGKFGAKKDYLISFDSILDNLILDDDVSSLVNYAVVLADKNEGGATSVTLREVYNRKDLQDENFPIIITGKKINTQASQIGYDFPEYAPNNIHEYAVLDLEGIRREDGDIYEDTFTMNDAQPIQEDGKPISNEDRLKVAQSIYNRAKRKLRASRRNLRYTFTVHDLPNDINVGDRIQLLFSDTSGVLTKCFNLKTTESSVVQDYFYIVNMELSPMQNGGIQYELTVAYDLGQYFTTREY